MKDVSSGLRLVKFEKGQNVFHHGDQGQKIYFVIKGVISVKIPFELNNKQIVSRWLKFRDVSIDQVHEREFRETLINKEYLNK